MSKKLIAKAFKEIGIIEKYGSGIKRIFTICKNYEIVRPKIEIAPNGFELILFKEKTDLETVDKLILELIQNKPKITINELSNKIGKGITSTKEKIKKLRNKNIIKRIGATKGGQWQIIK